MYIIILTIILLCHTQDYGKPAAKQIASSVHPRQKTLADYDSTAAHVARAKALSKARSKRTVKTRSTDADNYNPRVFVRIRELTNPCRRVYEARPRKGTTKQQRTNDSSTNVSHQIVQVRPRAQMPVRTCTWVHIYVCVRACAYVYVLATSFQTFSLTLTPPHTKFDDFFHFSFFFEGGGV